MTVTMDTHTLSLLLRDAASLGAEIALTASGSVKPYMSQLAACNKYGRANVERWIKEGLIEPKKDGATSRSKRLDRVQLESLAKTCNKPYYKKTIELNDN